MVFRIQMIRVQTQINCLQTSYCKSLLLHISRTQIFCIQYRAIPVINDLGAIPETVLNRDWQIFVGGPNCTFCHMVRIQLKYVHLHMFNTPLFNSTAIQPLFWSINLMFSDLQRVVNLSQKRCSGSGWLWSVYGSDFSERLDPDPGLSN
jgi:hypothetical protein